MTFFTDYGGSTSVLDSYDPVVGGIVAGSHLRSGNGVTLSHRDLYRTNIWVNVAVNLRARGIARTPLKAFRDGDDPDVDRTRLRTRGKDAHHLARLLERPWKGATGFHLRQKIALECLIDPHAECLLWMDKPGFSHLPQRLVPLRGDLVTRQYRADGSIGFYEWREHPGAKPLRILPECIARIGYADGVSPLTALHNELRLDDHARRTLESFYRNGAKVGGVLTTEQKLEPSDVEKIEAELRGEHQGVDNAFRTLVLANMPGAEWHSPSVSSSDAQTLEHRKYVRDATLAGFNTPQPMAGVLDRATFSNIETQTRMWVVESLGTDGAMIEAGIDGQIISVHPEWEDDGIFVEFDFSAQLKGTPLQRAEAYLKWINSGTRTPNENRKLENLPAIKDAWADAIWVPANLTPVGLPGGASGTPASDASPTGLVRRGQPPLPDTTTTEGDTP